MQQFRRKWWSILNIITNIIFSLLITAVLRLLSAEYLVKSFCLLTYWKKKWIEATRSTIIIKILVNKRWRSLASIRSNPGNESWDLNFGTWTTLVASIAQLEKRNLMKDDSLISWRCSHNLYDPLPLFICRTFC